MNIKNLLIIALVIFYCSAPILLTASSSSTVTTTPEKAYHPSADEQSSSALGDLDLTDPHFDFSTVDLQVLLAQQPPAFTTDVIIPGESHDEAHKDFVALLAQQSATAQPLLLTQQTST